MKKLIKILILTGTDTYLYLNIEKAADFNRKHWIFAKCKSSGE